ncbi:hypothetical protein ABC347_15080 [Sphingomonas sp. 1P06PA]|uniref:hypothetical protein n=1 Tax=Sphingomonas sp. 1P06PA TaxID=554121 RepID=UPI0039A754C3
MQSTPVIADRAVWDSAVDLRHSFGTGAAIEAAIRAGRSRDAGNVIHFCRWREVERLLGLLESDSVTGTRH